MPNDAFQAIDRQRLAEHPTDQFEHPIIEGRLEPGQTLPPERELSEKLCGRPASSTAGLVDVKVFLGGAPVTPEFTAQIGADGDAPDAAAAVDLVNRRLH
jgi:hypothetical protein